MTPVAGCCETHVSELQGSTSVLKLKWNPVHAVESQLHSVLPSTTDGDEWSAPSSGHTISRYALNRKLGEARGRPE